MNGSFTRTMCVCLLFATLVCSGAHAAAGGRALTLREAVDAALAGHPALQSFAFEFRAQDARIQGARLRPAPELSLDLENFAGTGEARGVESVEATLALSQVIELGGKRDARIAAARAQRDVLDIEREARQLDVLTEVTRRFITMAARQEQLRLAVRAVALAQETVAATERRVNAAQSPHAELDRARIALDRVRLDERRAAVALDTARKQLAAMWGASQPAIEGEPFAEVSADLFAMPVVGELDGLIDRLAGNPDFLRFASEARLLDAELRLAATLRKPDLTVSAGVRRLQGTQDHALVASFAIPLFGERRASSQLAEARANRARVDAERRNAEVKAQATLYELHRELARAVAEADALREDILPRAEEALNETEYAFDRGRYGYIELVDAQREFLALQASLIEASADAHALRAEIEGLTRAPLAGALRPEDATP